MEPTKGKKRKGKPKPAMPGPVFPISLVILGAGGFLKSPEPNGWKGANYCGLQRGSGVGQGREEK